MFSPYRDCLCISLGLLIIVRILETLCCHRFGVLLTKKMTHLHPILKAVAAASCNLGGVRLTFTINHNGRSSDDIQTLRKHEYTIHLRNNTNIHPSDNQRVYNATITFTSSCWALFPLFWFTRNDSTNLLKAFTTTTTITPNNKYYLRWDLVDYTCCFILFKCIQ